MIYLKKDLAHQKNLKHERMKLQQKTFARKDLIIDIV